MYKCCNYFHYRLIITKILIMETLIAIIEKPEDAKHFISYVGHMALDFNMKVHLVYVQEQYDYTLGPPPSPGYSATLEVQKNNERKAAKTLQRLIGEIRDELPGKISIEYSTEIADKSAAIMDYISAKKATMAVMEAREPLGFWSFTSSYLDVINSVTCPVWIIPHRAMYKPMKQIVYATDYKEEDLKTLRKFIELTAGQGPAITALHICDTVDFEEKVKQAGFNEMVQAKLGYKDITVKCLREKDNQNASQLINEYAVIINADLIVVLKENRNFFDTIFNPDSTKKIVKEAQMPVLVYIL